MRRKVQEIVVLLNADRKKAGALGVLVLVLGGVAIKTISDSRPARARASGSAADKEGEHSSDAVNLESMHGGPIVSIAMPEKPTRDLFLLNDRYFPAPEAPVKEMVQKSGDANVEVPTPRAPPDQESIAQRIESEVKELRLRSTLVGQNPIAVIEVPGAKEPRVVVSPGNEIAGFKVIEITARSVLLEKEGVRVELTRGLPER